MKKTLKSRKGIFLSLFLVLGIFLFLSQHPAVGLVAEDFKTLDEMRKIVYG